MAAIINTKVPGSGTGWMLAPIDPAAMPLPETLETGAESLLTATGSDATTNAGELFSSRLVAGTVAPLELQTKIIQHTIPKKRPCWNARHHRRWAANGQNALVGERGGVRYYERSGQDRGAASVGIVGAAQGQHAAADLRERAGTTQRAGIGGVDAVGANGQSDSRTSII